MKWLAVYKDQSYLSQYNEDGTENKYSDIKRDQLSHFALLSDRNKLVLSVEFDRPTQKLIYRQRTFTNLIGKIKGRVWLVGWHENIDGKSIKSICYVYGDGHIVLAGAKDDLELVEQEV